MSLFKKAIERNEQILVDNLVVDGLWTALQKTKVLTDRQCANCQSKSTGFAQVEELLKVLKLKDDKHFKGFCEALEATEQNSDVMNCFLGHCVQSGSTAVKRVPEPAAAVQTDVDQPVNTAAALSSASHSQVLPPTFELAFAGNISELMNKMDLSSGLLESLRDGNIINGQQYSAVKAKKTEYDKVNKLLDILSRQDDKLLTKFCDILTSGRQQHVVQILKRNGSKRAKNDDTVTVSTADDVDDDEDDDGPLENVTVRCTTEEFYLQHRREAYPMNRKLRGFACIINNHKFLGTSGLSARDGTEVDCSRLKDLFEQLHFKVKIFDDVSAAEMLHHIKQTAAETVDGATPQCFLLFVLSHGDIIKDTEVVFGTDGKPLAKMEIKNALSDTACPVLKEVPRILFFQCCRGAIQDYDVEDKDGTPTHFLVCLPTRKGYTSLRNKTSGSRYVKSIVKVFMNKACDTDIRTMLDEVRVEQRTHMTPDKRHQVSCYEDDLDRKKKFFFFPGVVFSA